MFATDNLSQHKNVHNSANFTDVYKFDVVVADSIS